MSDQTVAYNLPNDVLEKLVCSQCSSYLSCGPVKVQSNGAIICGRCSPSNNEDCTPQVLFETLMTNFAFPCRYAPQGCKKRLLFNHAVGHEHDCPYRTICCPSLPYESCKKVVCVFDIYNHFDEAHSDFILKYGKFKLEFEEDAQHNLLMIEDGAVVILQYMYDSVTKTLYVDVRHFAQDDSKIVNFKLQIISGTDSKRIVTVKERQCGRYESHTLNLQSVETLRIENYLPALGHPNFVYIRVKLVVSGKSVLRNENESSAVIKTLETEEEAILNIWNELESVRCNFCHLFLFPPVYYTTRSNVCICSKCRERDRRNAYEKIVVIPNYPCRWWGCTFIGNDQNIKDHIENCQFRTFICPLSAMCDEGFYTAGNLMEHMQRHGTYCPNPQKIVIQLFSDDDSSYEKNVYFTVFENRVIAFTCTVSLKHDWYLTSNTENLIVGIYFQHDHCRFKSKTLTYTDSIDTSYRNNVSDFPKCFSDCRRISAVLRIAKQN